MSDDRAPPVGGRGGGGPSWTSSNSLTEQSPFHLRHDIVYFNPTWEDGRPSLNEHGRNAVQAEYERSKQEIQLLLHLCHWGLEDDGW